MGQFWQELFLPDLTHKTSSKKIEGGMVTVKRVKEKLTLNQRILMASMIGVAIGIQIPIWLGLFQSLPGFIFGMIMTLSVAYLFYYIEKTVGMIGWTYSYIRSIKTGRFWANVFYQWLPATIAYVELLYIVLFVAVWKEYGIHFIMYSGMLHLGSEDIVFVTVCALVAIIATVADNIIHNSKTIKINKEFQGTTFLTVWRKFWSDLKIIFQFRPLRQDLVGCIRAVKTTAIWCFKTITRSF